MAELDPEWIWIVCGQVGGCASVDGEADDADEELIRPTNTDKLQMAEKHSNKRMAILTGLLRSEMLLESVAPRVYIFILNPTSTDMQVTFTRP